MGEVGKLAVQINPAPDTIEGLLTAMSKHGRPRLGLMDDGWYASINMDVRPEGVGFEVKSGFGHATPYKALATCYERMMAALQELRGRGL